MGNSEKTSMKLGVVILAAGQGTRMKSSLPKVLHRLADNPLLGHVIDTARVLQPEQIVVVYGHGGERVRESIGDDDLQWVEQAQQLGTGHAVAQALPLLTDVDQVLVLYGDVPLTSSATLHDLLQHAGNGFGLLTINLPDPSGYGRIVRDAKGQVIRIIEQKDASPDELAIQEINTGIMLIPADRLQGWLSSLSNNNAQGEYYLTDVIAMVVADGLTVEVAQPAAAYEAEGVNNRVQLAALERVYQGLQAERLMTQGVTMMDPTRFDLRGSLQHGEDVIIDINVIIEGEVTLGDNVRIGANTVLRNVVIEDDVVILENCVLEDAHVGAASKVGPFSRLRPGAELVGGAHVGNFVEIKKSRVGQGSKVNHLSYIGDCEIGVGVNIGAGTITCNYDGVNKSKTIIGDSAFIGSNTALIAPVTVGTGATIGAGSVITREAPDDALTLTRAKQITLESWQRPVKKKN